MSKLDSLKRNLHRLRHARRRIRWSSAFAALAIAALWALVAMFVIDFVFQIGVIERLIVLALAMLACSWAFLRWSLPLLGPAESLVDIALLVERNHQIDTDLVAALQFESGDAMQWGSWQLENAVIERVAQRTSNLDVFSSLSREQFTRRLLILMVTAGAIAVAAVLFPAHALTFLHRLALGSQHYPTRTVMQAIVINDQVVLQTDTGSSSRPEPVRCAQGAPLEMLVFCSGDLPASAQVTLHSLTAGTKRPLSLEKLTTEERQARIDEAIRSVEAALDDPSQDVTGPWATRFATLVRFESNEALELLEKLKTSRAETLRELSRLLAETRKEVEQSESTGLYHGRLERHVDKLEYQVFAGDAWTEPATIDLIPLPQVEPHLAVTAPPYATAWKAPDAGSFSRHLAVLEGSRIDIGITVSNAKPLEEAWLLVESEDEVQRFDLTLKASPDSEQEGLSWELRSEGTPFASLTNPLRYELQVTDRDGLHLDSPMVGYVRIQADRPPTASTSVVHRLVVPEATPVVTYRVHDDFGIRRIALKTSIERDRRVDSSEISGSGVPPQSNPDSDIPSETASDQSATMIVETEGSRELVIYDEREPIPATELPLTGEFPADLGKLGLQPGDRLILVLQVEDYRGEAAGETYEAEPLVLEIADASTVEAAILEADEQSEEKLSDIIKRQLGIGESP